MSTDDLLLMLLLPLLLLVVVVLLLLLSLLLVLLPMLLLLLLLTELSMSLNTTPTKPSVYRLSRPHFQGNPRCSLAYTRYG